MKLLDRFTAAAIRRRFSPLTGKCYARWIRSFLAFHRTADGRWRTRIEVAAPEVSAFRNFLARDGQLSALRQN